MLEKEVKSITLGEERDIPSIHHTTKNLKDVLPPLESDDRRDRSAIIFPRDVSKYPDWFRVHNLKLDTTHKGRDCFSCAHVSGSHVLSNVKLVVIGDQCLPASIGAETKCIPVIRIEDASFEGLKQVLWSQKNLGFRTAEGAIYAVSTLSYLCRVGNEMYWQGFYELEKWVKEKMGGILAPFLMPYGLLEEEYLSKVQQFFTVTRARYLGDMTGARTVWHYSFWKPLFEFYVKKAVVRRSIHVTTSMVRTPDGRIVAVESAQRAYQEIVGNYAKEYPPEHEEAFITMLMQHIESTALPTMLPIVPPTEWLDKGFEKDRDLFTPIDTDKPRLYLYGNSTLREAGAYINEEELCKDHVLVMNCKGGDINAILMEHPVPAINHVRDTVVLHFVGNISMEYDRYSKPDQNWHYVHPRILDDAAVSALIDKVITAINTVRKTFKGTIKVFGPLPRILNECCEDPSHLFAPPAPFKESPHNPVIAYYAALNQYMVCHPKLAATGVEIIPYQLVWLKKGEFNEKSLRDNLHLTEEANKIFANFIANLPTWKPKSYKLMEVDSAFKTWTALFYKWGKKKAPVQDPTQAKPQISAAGALPQQGAPQQGAPPPSAPPPPPDLPQQVQEKMDSSSAPAGTGGNGKPTETVANFLEKTAEDSAAAAAAAAAATAAASKSAKTKITGKANKKK